MEVMTKVYMLLWCLTFLNQALACKNKPETPAPSLRDVLNITGNEEKQTGIIKRGITPEFVDPGNGAMCALSPSHEDLNYEHFDEHGRRCTCELCRAGQILKRNCSCDPLEVRKTECDFVQENHMMPYISKCETGIRCKTCEWPLKEKSHCGPRGPDTECQCVAPDHYLAARDDCRPIPRCDKGHEPVAGYGEHFTEMQCQPCPEGYYQPNDNSTDKCGKSRVCTVEESTIYSDAKCLNDPKPVLSTTTTTSHHKEETSTVAPGSKVDMTNMYDAAGDDQVTASDGDVTPMTTVNRTTDVNGTETNGPTVPNEEGTQRPPSADIIVFTIGFIVGLLVGLAVCCLPFMISKIKELHQYGQYRPCRNDPSIFPDPDAVGEGVPVDNNNLPTVGVQVDNDLPTVGVQVDNDLNAVGKGVPVHNNLDAVGKGVPVHNNLDAVGKGVPVHNNPMAVGGDIELRQRLGSSTSV